MNQTASAENDREVTLSVLDSFFQFNHYLAVKYGQRVSIGCKDMTIEEWIEKGHGIGTEEGASDFEIEMYMKFVKEG